MLDCRLGPTLDCPGLVSHEIVPLRAIRCGIFPQLCLAMLVTLAYSLFLVACRKSECSCERDEARWDLLMACSRLETCSSMLREMR